MPTKQAVTLLCYLIWSLLLSSCAFLEKTQLQSQTLSELGRISGTVYSDELTDEPIIVSVLQFTDGQVEVKRQKPLDESGAYTLMLPPGQYYVLAYVDKNRNSRRDVDEISTMYQSDTSGTFELNIKKQQHMELASLSLVSTKQLVFSLHETYKTDKITQNIGKVIGLDNPLFSEENVKLGFWHPLDYVDSVVGGLMLLQPFAQNKTPVIFIHGIMGSPREFLTIIEQLDRDKFQPWVLYYPTGVPLDFISQYLADALHVLHNKYQFDNVQLISHSMGGLIARSYINKHDAARQLFELSLYVTINSPLNGMASAAEGVNSSPVVIASWRDLATGSEFINALHRQRLPESIPYHLFFSYLGDENGDGVVPLTSQLSISLQREALRIYASEASHAGILKDAQFIQRLNTVMQSPKQ